MTIYFSETPIYIYIKFQIAQTSILFDNRYTVRKKRYAFARVSIERIGFVHGKRFNSTENEIILYIINVVLKDTAGCR